MTDDIAFCFSSPLHVEVDADELAEPGAVVVAGRLGVSKRLQDRVRLHDLVLERRLLRLLLALPDADHSDGDHTIFAIDINRFQKVWQLNWQVSSYKNRSTGS